MTADNIIFSVFAWFTTIIMFITFYKLLIPKKSAVYGGIIISVAEGLLYYAIRFSELPFFLSIKEINLTMPLVTFVMAAANLGYTIFFFSDKLIRRVSLCFVMFAATIFSESVSVFIYTVVFKMDPNEIIALTGIHKVVDLVLKIFLYIITCLAVYFIFRKKTGIYSKSITLCLMGVLFGVLAFISVLANFNHLYYKNETYIAVYTAAVIIMLIFMISFAGLIKFSLANEREKYKSFWSGELQKMGIEKIEESIKNEEKISRIKHDFKDILICMKVLVDKGDTDSRSEVQKLISSELSEIETIKVEPYTDNIMVNTILSVKAAEAENDNIDIKTDIDIPAEFSPVQERDIDILTLNLLNNAVEACRRINNGERRTVDFRMKKKGNYLFIKTENPCDKIEQTKKGKFLTLKDDKFNHGKGIDIIEDISGKYDGQNEISYENNIFYHSVNIELI